MAIVIGNRPHRVNLDGHSCTEIGISDAALSPGQVVRFVNGKWVASSGAKPYTFIVQCADNVGGSILESIPAGDSVTGDRFEEKRQYAALVAAGTVLKAQETLLTVNTTGQLIPLAGDSDVPVAVAIEDYTVPATPAYSHVKIRVL